MHATAQTTRGRFRTESPCRSRCVLCRSAKVVRLNRSHLSLGSAWCARRDGLQPSANSEKRWEQSSACIAARAWRGSTSRKPPARFAPLCSIFLSVVLMTAYARFSVVPQSQQRFRLHEEEDGWCRSCRGRAVWAISMLTVRVSCCV